MTNEKTQFIESFMASATTIGTKFCLPPPDRSGVFFSSTGDLSVIHRGTAGDERQPKPSVIRDQGEALVVESRSMPVKSKTDRFVENDSIRCSRGFGLKSGVGEICGMNCRLDAAWIWAYWILGSAPRCISSI